MLDLTVFLCMSLGAQPGTPEPIVIDGRFDDWDDTPALITDPADAPDGLVDLGEVRVAHDDRFVHLLVDLGRVVNVQGMNGTLRIVLDADGNAGTGNQLHGVRGADVVIELSPRREGGRVGSGVGLRSTTVDEPLSPYDIGFTNGPTYAGDWFELRMERGAALPRTPPFLEGMWLSGRLVFLDADGEVADETDIFRYQLTSVLPDRPRQPTDPLTRPRGATLRVVSWNMEFGGVFRTPAPFGRVLRALEPDVILFQEVRRADTLEQLRELLENWLPRKWTVIVGEGGNDLRCAVAARSALDPIPALTVVPYPDLPQQSIRIAAGALTVGRRRLLVASVHLMCCGRAGGFQDRTRQVEADAIRRAVGGATAGERFDGVILAGDLNLVGSRQPLVVLRDGLDTDGTALSVAETLQLDGRSNATWSSPAQPFVPGRLDFLLYSDAGLDLINAFSFEAGDLLPRWRSHHKLEADDSSASDHHPVVADFK